MRAPAWIDDVVRGFGRNLELDGFTLGEKGVAAVRFENGVLFKLEYSDGMLWVRCGVVVRDYPSLAAAHLSRSEADCRAAYLAKSGEAFYAARIADRDIGIGSIDAAFHRLFSAAERLGRFAA